MTPDSQSGDGGFEPRTDYVSFKSKEQASVPAERHDESRQDYGAA